MRSFIARFIQRRSNEKPPSMGSFHMNRGTVSQTVERQNDRRRFGDAVASTAVKIQIGARGRKISPSWLCVDLYDDSTLVDKHWDLHCLPIEDNVIDCYMCNAVLEHVPDPQLALFEMFRTLRPGGQIWLEVPFMQFFHGHPGDYFRWTLSGLKLFGSDFYEISSGISVRATHEARKIMEYTSNLMHTQIDDETQRAVVEWFIKYDEAAVNPRCYSMVYFHGEKREGLPSKKYDYLVWCRSKYVDCHGLNLSYDPDKLLGEEAIRECVV